MTDHNHLADNECPSCHQLPHRPPTDYCTNPNHHRQAAGYPDAQPIELPDPASVPYGTEIGTYRAMGDPVRWVQHWAARATHTTHTTHTTQATATASTPPTQTRGIFSDIDHTVFVGSRSTTHLRTLCRPQLCGAEPTPSQ